MKKVFALFVLFCSLTAGFGQEQNVEFVASVGGGAGYLSEDFTYNGDSVSLTYPAGGLRFNAELVWDRVYLEMALAALLFPQDVRLGGDTVDLSGYSQNSGADLTAFALGYSVPFMERFAFGTSLGFHFSSVSLSPKGGPSGGDDSRLTLEGYYGLIGLNLTPRLRWYAGKSLVVTLEFPVGWDFGPVSEDVVMSGVKTGTSSPAIVSPAGLKPLFTGYTLGCYASLGYRFPIGK